MSPSQENWSPSEGNFKPLDKAFSTIVHGRLVGYRVRTLGWEQHFQDSII